MEPVVRLEAEGISNDPSTDEYLIPVSCLKGNSSLQAIVSFLKSKGLRFSQIAKVLNRDQRTVWCTYKNSGTISLDDPCEYFIPASIFSSRNLSVLESVVFYLMTNYDLTFKDVSGLLGKNYRTIWTVYRRALGKL